MAASVMSSLRTGQAGEGSDLLGETDPVRLAVRVLSLVNADLKPHILAPFRSEASFVSYVRQLLDFWSYDTRDSAARVLIPVLFVGAEHDRVVSPAGSQVMARCFPAAHHVEIAGATHYCFYDRPDLIAGLLEDFFRERGTLRRGERIP
jgi:pimeloyl-ACP methyl ester carboxylesterase